MKAYLLKAEMEKNNISQEKLALELGICRNQLNRKLNGKYTFSVEEAKKISEILHLENPLDIFFN